MFYAIGTGDLEIQVPNGVNSTRVILCNVLHTLDMGLMVVSINQVMAAGHKVLFDGNSCKIKNPKGVIIGKIPVGVNRLYKVKHVNMIAKDAWEMIKLLELHR